MYLLFSKQAELEKKKAEVRARLEATTAGNKKKKGFMTPERKKKLRVRIKRSKPTTVFGSFRPCSCACPLPLRGKNMT